MKRALFALGRRGVAAPQVAPHMRKMMSFGPEGDTVFGEIIRGDTTADKVYEDEDVLAFNDIHPVAPVHVLLIPKRRIPSISRSEDSDAETLGKLLTAARKVAEELRVNESGYRLVINDGKHGCQTVDHVHVHLMAGRQLGWPPC